MHSFFSWQINQVISLMKENFNSAKICPYKGKPQDYNFPFSSAVEKSSNYVTGSTEFCDLKLDPDLNRYAGENFKKSSKFRTSSKITPSRNQRLSVRFL
jgi:hypothetical protein